MMNVHRLRAASGQEHGLHRGHVDGLRIHVLNRFEVMRAGARVEGIQRGAAHDLLCYVLLFRDRAHAREALVERLWGDSPPAAARKRLRQALWQLQAALGDSAALEVGPAAVAYGRVDWLDVEAFEHAHAVTAPLAGQEFDASTVLLTDEAVHLYGSGLLPGVYDDWCVAERERLQAMYVGMLTKLMDYFEHRGDYRASINYGEAILRADPAHELTHRRLMLLLYLAGDRTAALRQFRRCAAALEEELGVGVSHRTTAVLELIQADAMPSAVSAQASGSVHQALVEMSGRIREMQSLLLQFQSDIAAANADLQAFLAAHAFEGAEPSRRLSV